MKNLVLPVLVIVPLTVGGLWVLTGSKSETVAALPGPDEQVIEVKADTRTVGTGPLIAPIACTDPATCIVQNHVDMKAGPGIADFACGGRTEDEHQGVDFRILDLPTMLTGVPVIAVADGEVIGARGSEYDGAWKAGARDVVGARECGNGVAIRHDDGLVTQVCHLRRDSVLVEEGERVTQGQRIASVGMSGKAEYPHVHLSVTRDGERVDPFTNRAIGAGCGGAIDGGLWSGVIPDHWRADAGPFAFKSGFAGAPVTLATIERSLAAPKADSAALVFYTRAVSLKEGDIEKIALTGPEGFDPYGSVSEPLDGDRAQTMRFVGRPAGADAPLPTGEYQGHYQVLRDGEPVLDIRRRYVLQ